MTTRSRARSSRQLIELPLSRKHRSARHEPRHAPGHGAARFTAQDDRKAFPWPVNRPLATLPAPTVSPPGSSPRPRPGLSPRTTAPTIEDAMDEPPPLRPRHHAPVPGEIKRTDADLPADARRRRAATAAVAAQITGTRPRSPSLVASAAGAIARLLHDDPQLRGAGRRRTTPTPSSTATSSPSCRPQTELVILTHDEVADTVRGWLAAAHAQRAPPRSSPPTTSSASRSGRRTPTSSSPTRASPTRSSSRPRSPATATRSSPTRSARSPASASTRRRCTCRAATSSSATTSSSSASTTRC